MKKNIICSLFISVFLVFQCAGSSAVEHQSTKHIFDNGLTILVTELPSSPVVSVYALVKTGSANEGKFLGTGISHFLEHMLFKGTHGRGVGEVAARIQSVGGTINAATSRDYTIYTLTVPYESFDVALDILSDMLMNATMDAQEVERERKVIFSEVRLYQDNPDRKQSENVFKNAYIQHPYRHPIIGYETLLADVTREDLLEYYNTFYTPNNVVFSVSGNIDRQAILPKIKETFKDYKRGRPVTRNLPQEPPQISRRHYEEEYSTDLTRLSMLFSSVSLLHPDLYALDVLAGILGQGKSSRLYLDIYKEKELVHQISSYNYTPVDKGVFWISCLLEQKNVDLVKNDLSHANAQIKKTGVKAEELEKVKQQVRSEHILGHQTASDVTYAQAVDEAFTGDHQFSKKYTEAVNRVTNEDIKRVANQYLIESGLTTVLLKPKQEVQVSQEQNNAAEQGKIRKHILDNGLTVLIREDSTFPLIAMRLSVNGGVRQETAELSGLSEMTASTWIKGTKKYSAKDIAEKTESLGMRLGSFSGRNSLGLSFQFLKEQLPDAFDLLQELIMHPEFPPQEIDKVKEAMRTMIRQRDDDIFQSTAHLLKETLFQTHPFRLEQGGTLESIDVIERKDVQGFYEQLIAPSNMVLSIFGDLNGDAVLSDVDQILGSLKDQEVTLKTHAEEPPNEPRDKILEMDKAQAMVMMGFQGAQLGHADYYGIDVLTSILGSSFNGRIFMNIRDQLGEAYTLGGNFIPGPDMGLIYFYVLTTGEKAQTVKKLLKKEIEKIRSKNVSDQELQDIKTYLKGTFKAAQETNASLSFTVGLDELYGLGFDRYQNYDERIDAVTADDIRRLAQTYLDLNKMSVVVTMPQENKD